MNNFGYTPIASCPFAWETGKTYQLRLQCTGPVLTLFIDGTKVVSCSDPTFTFGMFGCGSLAMGRTRFGDFSFREL